MSRNLTTEAAEGWQYAKTHDTHPMTATQLQAACPYLRTSPSALAWHAGRAIYLEGEPCPVDAPLTSKERRVLMSSRGDSMVLRGYKQIELGRYATDRGCVFYFRSA